ncbi:MAG: DegV family protein [Syntrophomonas sp.]|nr:DegV family protein [Syntrophomonas sp.]
MGVKIVTDSTSYIDVDVQRELDIAVIPLSVSFPDETFLETQVDYDYFYNKIEKEGIIPTSSQPAQGKIHKVFADIVEQENEVLAIFLSSDMSGTYDSALAARELIMRENPAARIEVIDSRTNCMAMGLSVLAAARAAREGKSLAESAEAARRTMKQVKFYFVPAGLEYLKKGGRIGGAAALLGSILNLKPILYVKNGKTAMLEKVRGTRAAIERLTKLLEEDNRLYGVNNVIVHHISCPDKAAQLAQTIKQRYGLEAEVLSIGPVIGLHVGPGTLSVIYCTEDKS